MNRGHLGVEFRIDPFSAPIGKIAEGKFSMKSVERMADFKEIRKTRTCIYIFHFKILTKFKYYCYKLLKSSSISLS